jgi:hypothetical protein
VTQDVGGATRCNMKTRLQTRSNQEEKWIRGGIALQGRCGASREQEEVMAQQQGQCNNQLANKSQTGDEASVDKKRQSVERTRGGHGAMRGVATTSRQMRGKRGGGTSGQRGSSVLKAGGTSRQQEVEVAWQEDKRRRQCILRMRGKGGGRGGGGAIRGDATTSQGKLKVNGGGQLRGWWTRGGRGGGGGG